MATFATVAAWEQPDLALVPLRVGVRISFVTLYELVLPREGRLREDLGWRLFGVGGTALTGPVLKRFEQHLTQFLDKRESEIVSRIAEAVGVNPDEVVSTTNPATGRPGVWTVPIDLVSRLEGSADLGDQEEEEE